MGTVVIIFEITFEWFSGGTESICLQAHGGFTHEQQEHAVALIIATFFPLSLFFGFWRLECISCFYHDPDEEDYEDEVTEEDDKLTLTK